MGPRKTFNSMSSAYEAPRLEDAMPCKSDLSKPALAVLRACRMRSIVEKSTATMHDHMPMIDPLA